MRNYVSAFATGLSTANKASHIMAKFSANFSGPIGSLLIALSVILMSGMTSTAFADEVSIGGGVEQR